MQAVIVVLKHSRRQRGRVVCFSMLSVISCLTKTTPRPQRTVDSCQKQPQCAAGKPMSKAVKQHSMQQVMQHACSRPLNAPVGGSLTVTTPALPGHPAVLAQNWPHCFCKNTYQAGTATEQTPSKCAQASIQIQESEQAKANQSPACVPWRFLHGHRHAAHITITTLTTPKTCPATVATA